MTDRPGDCRSWARGVWTACCCALLWSGAAAALSDADIRHLCERVGFAPSPADKVALRPLSRAESVDWLLAQGRRFDSTISPPNWARKPWDPRRNLEHTPAEMAGPRQMRPVYLAATRAWTLDALIDADSALRARMFLFWLDYFAVQRTDFAPHSVWFLQELYGLSLERFDALLRAFSRSPTVQENLDLRDNKKDSLNENFARELLELYTIGTGHYSQQDIVEVARAFTGWRYIERTGWLIQWPFWHDYGSKTVLGHRGRLDGDDVLAILLEHPQTAVRLVERLWHEFVSPQLGDAATMSRLVAVFRTDRSIAKLLRALMVEPAFWAEENRKRLVKSPIELAVGALRERGVSGGHGAALEPWVRVMGQTPLLPPDVRGWPGHTAWLTVGNLDARMHFLSFIDAGPDRGAVQLLSSERGIDLMAAAVTQLDAGLEAPQAALWQALEGAPMVDAAGADNPWVHLR